MSVKSLQGRRTKIQEQKTVAIYFKKRVGHSKFKHDEVEIESMVQSLYCGWYHVTHCVIAVYLKLVKVKVTNNH